MFQFPDGGNKSSAKLVDLDTQAQLFSEIWGWRIRIGDFFSADFTPVPFQYMWKKMVNDQRRSHTYGAAYQSVLSNIRWIQNGKSSFVSKLRKAMENDNIDSNRLSIRLSMDMYQNDSSKDSFTTGRITGTSLTYSLTHSLPYLLSYLLTWLVCQLVSEPPQTTKFVIDDYFESTT